MPDRFNGEIERRTCVVRSSPEMGISLQLVRALGVDAVLALLEERNMMLPPKQHRGGCGELK
ncbi:MAG: hypothetical protein Fur0034_01970 [Desulfuromonadia bacterium]